MGHVSQGLEVGGTQFRDGVGRSPEVQEDLGMARNTEAAYELTQQQMAE